MPALWLRQTATVPATISLLQLRAQASFIPTHRHNIPARLGTLAIHYRTFLLRPCPYCPLHVGEEIHMLLQCPGLAPVLAPIHQAFSALLSEYDIIDIPMTHFDYLSLLLGTDPCLYLQGVDRLDWITRAVLLSIRLAGIIARSLPL